MNNGGSDTKSTPHTGTQAQARQGADVTGTEPQSDHSTGSTSVSTSTTIRHNHWDWDDESWDMASSAAQKAQGSRAYDSGAAHQKKREKRLIRSHHTANSTANSPQQSMLVRERDRAWISNDLSRPPCNECHGFVQIGGIPWSGNIRHKLCKIEADQREDWYWLLDLAADLKRIAIQPQFSATHATLAIGIVLDLVPAVSTKGDLIAFDVFELHIVRKEAVKVAQRPEVLRRSPHLFHAHRCVHCHWPGQFGHRGRHEAHTDHRGKGEH